MSTTPDINATPAAGHWQDVMPLSVNDVEALLSGAIQLAENADSTLEELHG